MSKTPWQSTSHPTGGEQSQATETLQDPRLPAPWPPYNYPPPPWGSPYPHPLHQASPTLFSGDGQVSRPPLHQGPGPGFPSRQPLPFAQSPRPPFPQHGLRPRYIQESARPPYPNEGPRPPYPNEGPRPPYPNEGPRPPYPNEGPRPPYPNDDPRPPYPNEGPRPPYPNAGPRPPYPSTGPRPPNPNDPFLMDYQSSVSGIPSVTEPHFPPPNVTSSVIPSPSISQQANSETKISDAAENEDAKQRAADNNWLKNFLATRCKSNQKPKMEYFPIYEAHSLLREALTLKLELRDLLEAAQSGDKPSENIHQSFTRVKNRLQAIEETFKDEVKLKSLQRRCSQIKKKRLRLQRQRAQTRDDAEEREIRRQEIDSKIDKWQTGLLEKEAEVKKAKELKNSADRILSEVTRKQTEAKRSLNLLKALSRLRDVRKDKAQRKGLHVSASSDEVFQQRLTYLEEMWQKRKENYEEEQRVLEVMMEVENEEMKEKEKEKARTREERKLKEYQRNLKQYLFGKDVKITAEDPMFSFRQYYESANHSPDSLVRIRQEWDMFLVREPEVIGSRVPQGWVLPPEPSNPIWATALKINQKPNR